MDLNVKITVSADPEMLTHLSTLACTIQEVLHVSNAQLMEAAATVTEASVTEVAEAPEAPAKKPSKKRAVVEKAEAPAEVPVENPAEEIAEEEIIEAPQVTMEEVRKLCMEVVQADRTKKAGLAAALKSCGGDKLSDIPAENLGRLAELVRAL